MNNKHIKIIAILLYLVILSCGQDKNAELILVNGKIFSGRDSKTFVEALAVGSGAVKAAGSNEEIRNWQDEETSVIDLKKRLVLPAFHDAHLHFWSGSHLRHQVNLIGTKSKADVLKHISQKVKSTVKGEWIVGRGWDHELWEDKKFPTHFDLDHVAPQNPVFLKRVDGHAAWVNKIVLDKFGFSSSIKDPPGGKIVRFENSNQPTGILIDNAYELIEKVIPEPRTYRKMEILVSGIRFANKLGITTISDISSPSVYPIYADLLNQNKLNLRVHFWVEPELGLDSLRKLFNRFNPDNKKLNANLIKLYADGSLGSRSAHLLKPYNDDEGNYGLPQYPFKTLLNKVREADLNGWRIGIHAIGDAANRTVLDVYQKISQERFNPGRRWRIEHAQVVHPEDVKRFSELNVIASMQPTHCISDMKWAAKRIGDRTRYAYVWKTMLKNNVMLAFGTDWPVEPLNPLIGIYAAVTRQDTLGNPAGGWHPEEKLTVGEAVYAYTYGSAFAANSERWQGQLLPGYVADFIILDQNIFTVPPEMILKTRIIATYMDGRKIYP